MNARTLRRVALAVAGASVMASCSAAAIASPRSPTRAVSEVVTTTTGSTPTAPTPPPADTDSIAAILAGAGIATVVDEADSQAMVAVTGRPSPVRVSAWQVTQFAAELDSGSGILGATLDAAAPLPAEIPPMSFLIAGWVTAADGPAADAARMLMGDQDWSHAPQVRFPTVVLTLFVSDAAMHGDSVDEAPAVRPQGLLAPAPAANGLPCSTVANFVNDVLTKVFEAFKLDPATVASYVSGAFGDGVIGGALGAIGGWLAGWWNSAVDLARSALETVVATLTRPIVDAVKLAVGAVATVTIVASYLKHWSAPVTATTNPDRFAVGSEADRTGQLTVRIDPDAETDDWPPVLEDCAQAVGLELPSLSKEHMPVEWTLITQSAAGIVNFAAPGLPLTGELHRDLTSSIDYTTGREDEATAQGREVNDTVEIGVHVRRTEVEQLRTIIRGFITGQVPDVVAPVVNPILASYLSDVFKHLDDITAVDGTITLAVSHHVPPEPTTTSSSPCAPAATIPPGTYAATPGQEVGRFVLTEHRPGQGDIHERISESEIELTSDGSTVHGSMSISWAGEGDLIIAGTTTHIVEQSSITDGVISGPADDPVLDATIVGTETVDGDPISGSRTVHVHLHTTFTCGVVAGDAVAMLQETVDGVFDTITVELGATWLASTST